MRFLFDILYLLALVATLPYWFVQSLRTGKYREGIVDRFLGRTPVLTHPSPVVWIHAVSLGEVLLVRPLVDRLRKSRPDLDVVLSATTDTGVAIGKETFPDATVFRSPLDFSWSVKRAFRSIRPELLVLVELELWPNLLMEARRRQVPVAVVNARVSRRSHRGYRRIRRLLGPALRAIRWWGAQSDEYARRIEDLYGKTASARVEVTGSMKYDGAATDRANPKTAAIRRLLGIRDLDRVLVCGSTQAPEEEILLDIWPDLRRMDPRLRLVLVPRHPERFDTVAGLLQSRRLEFVRRSRIDGGLDACPPVLLLDTVGELSAAWGLADMGYVGGSLECRRGGQSMIEPAAFAVPVCFGPNTWNFRSTVEELLRRQAARQIAGRTELRQVLQEWVADPNRASEIGRRARQLVQEQQGAIDRTLLGLAPLLPAPVHGGRAIA